MQRYRLSFRFVLWWLLTLPFVRRRDLGADGERQLARYRPSPRAIGTEHVPPEGPFIVVANHYERDGLRVWWPGMLVSSLVARERPGQPGIRWMTTDRFDSYRLFGLIHVPEAQIARLLRMAARRYEIFLRARDEVAPRVPMLRHIHRTLHRERRPIGLMPEAGNAVAGEGLALAVPGAGPALRFLSSGRIPLLPVAVYDDVDGHLTARFGPTFLLTRDDIAAASERSAAGHPGGSDAALTARVMREIAALLPHHLRGAYREVAS